MKYMVLIMALAGAVFAQTKLEEADSQVWETIGTLGSTAATQYTGFARTTKNSAAVPSTNSAIWKIRKIVYDSAGEVTAIRHARPTGGALYGNAWTNRAAASYY